MNKILYLGWVGRKNLGDDLMLNVFKSIMSRENDNKEIQIIPSFPEINLNNIDNYDIIVLGGGSLILEDGFINTLYKATKKNKKIFIWGSGVDNRTSNLSVEKSISKHKCIHNNVIKKEFINKLIEVLLNSNFIGVRGPLTFKFLKDIGINKDRIDIIGDPGFMLEYKAKDNLSRNNKIIGLNWGNSNNVIYGQNEIEVENQLVKAIHILINMGYKIYIYTVWDKDIKHNERIYKKIDDKTNVVLSTELYTENELMERIANFDLTINFKLHSNLISLACDVPFIPLGYRLKVYDFAQSIKLGNIVVDTASKEIKENIINNVEYIVKNRDFLISNYNIYKHLYRKKLIKSIHNILDI